MSSDIQKGLLISIPTAVRPATFDTNFFVRLGYVNIILVEDETRKVVTWCGTAPEIFVYITEETTLWRAK